MNGALPLLLFLAVGMVLMLGYPVAFTLAGVSLAFALAGAALSATTVGFGGYILELGTPDIRPLLFALEGTLLMPLYFMPLFGGWLADEYGYRTVVLVGGALLIGALTCAATLCEPRRGDPACGPCTANLEEWKNER